MIGPRRRTQAERSAATKQRLLTATVDCLHELGFHKTTTSCVEQRAGVTRGALLHHFPSKTALIIAAAEHIVHVSEIRLLADVASIAGSNPAEQISELLWRQFTSPSFLAFMEICMAARTDPVLSQALAEPQKILDAHCRDVIAKIIGDAGDNADSAMAVELSIRFLRGAAVGAMLGERPEAHDEIRREWQRLIAPRFVSAGS